MKTPALSPLFKSEFTGGSTRFCDFSPLSAVGGGKYATRDLWHRKFGKGLAKQLAKVRDRAEN